MADLVTNIEKKTGIVAREAKHSADFKTAEQLMQDYTDHPERYVGVSYNDRVAFLEKNGYKLTRQNLINADLSAKQSQ